AHDASAPMGLQARSLTQIASTKVWMASARVKTTRGRIVDAWRRGRSRGILAAMAAATIDNDARAQQLARAIASDIQLYNKQKIEEALKNDNFFEALTEEITEGRDLFRGRVTPELFLRNYYDRAIVDRVVKPMASLNTPIW
ncbi:MAG: hypothetical protein ACPG77_04225, partial [Nannocystaceae bacterium]